jgi:sporulation protein YlmC with PRC-barrel domain
MRRPAEATVALQNKVPLSANPHDSEDHVMNTFEETRSTSLNHSDNPVISSERVTGTSVYNANGDKLGSIETVMIDKQSGQVRYAVMSFGGFLGIGEKYHQLPWDGLRYDEAKGGYIVNISREALEGAPSYDRDEVDSFDYSAEGDAIDGYYDRVDGFYSPEQQSRRNTGGFGQDLGQPTHPDVDGGLDRYRTGATPTGYRS